MKKREWRELVSRMGEDRVGHLGIARSRPPAHKGAVKLDGSLAFDFSVRKNGADPSASSGLSEAQCQKNSLYRGCVKTGSTTLNAERRVSVPEPTSDPESEPDVGQDVLRVGKRIACPRDVSNHIYNLLVSSRVNAALQARKAALHAMKETVRVLSSIRRLRS